MDEENNKNENSKEIENSKENIEENVNEEEASNFTSEIEKEDIIEEVEKEYVPEQLDDDDFEKEKEQEKMDKKAKKIAGKNNNEAGEAKPKKNGFKIGLIIFILLIIAGIVAYLVLGLSKPENVVNDFAIYFNNGEWRSLDDTIDWRGFLTLSLIDEENVPAEDKETEETTEEEKNEENEEASEEVVNEDNQKKDIQSKVSYMDYDSKYETVYEDLKAKGYEELKTLIEKGQKDVEKALSSMFDGTSITINEVRSVEKIENTKSLYKIKVSCTLTSNGESSTDDMELYVAKNLDGNYKLVGGNLPYYLYMSYVYYQYYGSMSN